MPATVANDASPQVSAVAFAFLQVAPERPTVGPPTVFASAVCTVMLFASNVDWKVAYPVTAPARS